MVKIEDLKRINMLQEFPDYLLETIGNEAQLSIFGTGTQLMTVGKPIHKLYMLIMGQVAIKRELTPVIDVILNYIQSGSSFGTSALLKRDAASYTATCQEPCEAISLDGKRMLQLFEENQELAYYMMLGVAKQYKRHMDQRTQMILKTLDEYPDLKDDILDIDNLTLSI